VLYGLDIYAYIYSIIRIEVSETKTEVIVCLHARQSIIITTVKKSAVLHENIARDLPSVDVTKTAEA
jgi:hypothetical protein